MVIGEEAGFVAVVIVWISSEQSAVVRRDVEVLFRNTARLTALVNEFEQFVKPVPEVVLPVVILRTWAVQFISDLLLEGV